MRAKASRIERGGVAAKDLGHRAEHQAGVEVLELAGQPAVAGLGDPAPGLAAEQQHERPGAIDMHVLARQTQGLTRRAADLQRVAPDQATGRVDQHVVTDRIPFRVQTLQDPQRASVPMSVMPKALYSRAVS